ncbi:MAG: hypothetical protein KJ057_06815 [Phycisphaerae bacterium]|nr:MAG: hypothetical protein F9K17_06740 [Phycisphaerae bacterium]MBE7456662.1 hypothetical protein [Planctomycetia bacterium]MCK6463958.1 hypothetical protein [Phycisphaerae bacterium]MCL4718173.1 hypothetical protein [Phycisphaerae bacterium]NUQ07989.1 hypothetical protein [Phycisphaerae bacterium]
MSGDFRIFLGGLAAAGIVVLTASLAHRAALRLAPRSGPVLRLAAAAIVSCWLMMTLGSTLLSLGAFRIEIVLLVLVLIRAGFLLSRSPRPPSVSLSTDIATAFRRITCGMRGPLTGVAIASLAIVAVRVLRGLVAPPLAWDALTYHLFKAGRWVQTGHWAHEIAPDAWGYYAYSPPGGDLLWAVAMLPLRSDLLLAPAGASIWALIGLGAWGTARSLGARRRTATAAALAVLTLPAVVNYLTAAYVENTTLALVLLSAPFLRRALVRPCGGDAALAVAALACAAGVKVTALPLLLGGVVVVGGAWGKAPQRRVKAARIVLACLPALPGYVIAWRDTGNPLYPLEVGVGQSVLLPGNEERTLVHSARIARGLDFDGVKLVDALSFPHLLRAEEHLGLGPLWPVWLLAGGAGAGGIVLSNLKRTRARRTEGAASLRQCKARDAASSAVAWTSALMLAGAGTVIAGFASESERALRTLFVLSAGRFLALPCAVLVILATHLPRRAFETLATIAAAVGVGLAIPLGWSREDVAAGIGAMPVFGVAAILGCAAWALGYILPRLRASRAGVKVAAAAVGLAACLPWFQTHKDRWRYPIYAAAAEGRAYDAHPLRSDYAASWTIWRHFDAAPGVPGRGSTPTASLTIAVAAGFDGIGHNWFRYPFLGRRLSNKVVYIAPTRDGSVIDYRLGEELLAEADFETWVGRLRDVGVDAVAALPPRTIEEIWMTARSDIFEPVAEGVGGAARAWRLRSEDQ